MFCTINHIRSSSSVIWCLPVCLAHSENEAFHGPL